MQQNKQRGLRLSAHGVHVFQVCDEESDLPHRRIHQGYERHDYIKHEFERWIAQVNSQGKQDAQQSELKPCHSKNRLSKSHRRLPGLDIFVLNHANHSLWGEQKNKGAIGMENSVIIS